MKCEVNEIKQTIHHTPDLLESKCYFLLPTTLHAPPLSTHPFLQSEFLDHREGSEPLSSHREWDIPS